MTPTSLSRRGFAAGALACGVTTALSACGRALSASTAVAGKVGAVDDLAAMLGRHGFSGKTLESVIDALDQDVRPRPLGLRAQVQSSSVVLTDDKGELTAPLTGNRHYLAIAPFEVKTHECHDHDAGSCTGELTDQPVHVTITASDGTELVDTDAVTYANGFVGFWVPRQLKGTVVVTCNGKRGQVSFSSDAKGATCLTNLQVN